MHCRATILALTLLGTTAACTDTQTPPAAVPHDDSEAKRLASRIAALTRMATEMAAVQDALVAEADRAVDVRTEMAQAREQFPPDAVSAALMKARVAVENEAPPGSVLGRARLLDDEGRHLLREEPAPGATASPTVRALHEDLSTRQKALLPAAVAMRAAHRALVDVEATREAIRLLQKPAAEAP